MSLPDDAITVYDRTPHTARVLPEQALAYTRRVMGASGFQAGGTSPIFCDFDGLRSFVPMRPDFCDYTKQMAELIDELAQREGVQPSVVLTRMSLEVVDASRSGP